LAAVVRQIQEQIRQAVQEPFQAAPNDYGAHLGQENASHDLDENSPKAGHVHKSTGIDGGIPQETHGGHQKDPAGQVGSLRAAILRLSEEKVAAHQLEKGRQAHGQVFHFIKIALFGILKTSRKVYLSNL